MVSRCHFLIILNGASARRPTAHAGLCPAGRRHELIPAVARQNAPWVRSLFVPSLSTPGACPPLSPSVVMGWELRFFFKPLDKSFVHSVLSGTPEERTDTYKPLSASAGLKERGGGHLELKVRTKCDGEMGFEKWVKYHVSSVGEALARHLPDGDDLVVGSDMLVHKRRWQAHVGWSAVIEQTELRVRANDAGDDELWCTVALEGSRDACAKLVTEVREACAARAGGGEVRQCGYPEFVVWRSQEQHGSQSDGRLVTETSIAHLPSVVAAIAQVGPHSDHYDWARRGGLYLRREALVTRLLSQRCARAGAAAHDGAEAQPPSPTVVVDTRDDDAAGGCIRGALHLPDGRFDASSVAQILQRVRHEAAAHLEKDACAADDEGGSAASVGAAAGPSEEGRCLVVFHCMESVRRGPRCARRFVDAMQALAAESHAPPALHVRVLEGGADQWMRHHFEDARLVEGYDEGCWGFRSMCGTQMVLREACSGTDDDRESEDDDDCMAAMQAEWESLEQGCVDAAASHHPLYQRPADQPATTWSGPGAGNLTSS